MFTRDHNSSVVKVSYTSSNGDASRTSDVSLFNPNAMVMSCKSSMVCVAVT